jgi:hypothetical protein
MNRAFTEIKKSKNRPISGYLGGWLLRLLCEGNHLQTRMNRAFGRI